MFTPMLMKACTPSQTPTPCATSAGVQTLEGHRLATDGEGALDQQPEQDDDHQYADKAEFFGDHRQQEVGMRFRQIEQLLDAAPSPTPSSSPRPKAISACESW
jgi:hypothetical protein